MRDAEGYPIEGASISVKGTDIKITSNARGKFEVEYPCIKGQLEIKHPTYARKTVELRASDNQVVEVTLEDFFLDTVTITEINRTGVQYMPKIELGLVPVPGSGIEGLIKTFGLGVRSNNEMSSTYSVRGGNFDENLIYVNDIEIYRPFLVRSGQQEGLSFINPDLVDQIYFSSGGFESRFDDKISSVLAVRYRSPDEFKGTLSGSVMGGTMHLEGVGLKNRFKWMLGARYQANSYILNSLDTKGDYKPRFSDGQILLGYDITDKLNIQWLGYFSSNNYRVVPETRETEFGTINEALKLTVFYEGQEITLYRTLANAITLTYHPSKTSELKWISSWFNMYEAEKFDILGQYLLGDLEKDPGSENFGQVVFVRGIGGFLEHARNLLKSNIINSKIIYRKSWENNLSLETGAKFQYQMFNDKISEWDYLDSAGYNIPQAPADEITLSYVLKSKANLTSQLMAGFAQVRKVWNKRREITKYDSSFVSQGKTEIVIGARANYLDLNGEFTVGPRASLMYVPNWFKKTRKGLIKRRNLILRAATGIYYQPPQYRELRAFDGTLNTNLKAQRSIHFIAGGDLFFTMWNRTFKYTAEAYYKQGDNVIPYEVDNVRLRYYAKNNATAYATGIDMKIHGEFIKGIESWATVSYMVTKEDILDDYYNDYFNSDGEKIQFGYTSNDSIVDSVRHEPGYIPRPTDQRVSFGMYFQDEMPGVPQFKVHLNLLFITGIAYGPPDLNRFKDTLRAPAYRRVDIGFSYELWYNKKKLKPNSFIRKLDGAWVSLEIFNLLGISNTISYNWIEDVSGRSYAVPNYLTARRFNLKLLVKF